MAYQITMNDTGLRTSEWLENCQYFGKNEVNIKLLQKIQDLVKDSEGAYTNKDDVDDAIEFINEVLKVRVEDLDLHESSMFRIERPLSYGSFNEFLGFASFNDPLDDRYGGAIPIIFNYGDFCHPGDKPIVAWISKVKDVKPKKENEFDRL